MSTFTTGIAQRRGKRAKLYGKTARDITSTTGFSAPDQFLSKVGVPNAASSNTLQWTTLGGSNSKGIVINSGLHKPDYHRASNPDGRDIPLGTSGEDGGKLDSYPNDNVAHPDYPISYAGPGYLRFDSEVMLPIIRGPLNITGNLNCERRVTVQDDIYMGGVLRDLDGNAFSSPVVGAWTPTLEDGSGNQATLTTAVGHFSQLGSSVELSCQIVWSSLGSISGAVRVAGFPYTHALGTAVLASADTGVVVDLIGAKVHVNPTIGQSYFLLSQADKPTGAAPSDLTHLNLLGAGEIDLFGTVVLP